MLADDIVWHEPGQFDYSGDHRGNAAVVTLVRSLEAATGGTFTLEPGKVLTTREYAVTIVRWAAERDGNRAEGDEVAVYRLRAGQVAEAWFFPGDQRCRRARRRVRLIVDRSVLSSSCERPDREGKTQ